MTEDLPTSNNGGTPGVSLLRTAAFYTGGGIAYNLFPCYHFPFAPAGDFGVRRFIAAFRSRDSELPATVCGGSTPLPEKSGNELPHSKKKSSRLVRDIDPHHLAPRGDQAMKHLARMPVADRPGVETRPRQ